MGILLKTAKLINKKKIKQKMKKKEATFGWGSFQRHQKQRMRILEKFFNNFRQISILFQKLNFLVKFETVFKN